MSWLWISLQFLLGCGLLAWGADRFIRSSAVIADALKLPPIVAGMLIVGFGTSFPEIVVSAIAAFHGSAGIAIGNAIGSNIANIGLVLGIAALITPLTVHFRFLKIEMPVLMVITLIVGALLLTGSLSRLDGAVLVLLLVMYLYWMFFVVPKNKSFEREMKQEFKEEMPAPAMSIKLALFWWVVGLVLLFISSEFIVSGATAIAKLLQISDFLIGITIVALGTSLPELATTVTSAIKGQHDVAVGNVIGSNVFNLLAVLAMPALIAPSSLPSSLLYRDYPFMTGLIALLWLLIFLTRKQSTLGRLCGVVFLLGYVGFVALMVL